MSDEKTQSAGTLTEDAPGPNTVEVTFLPEGKTVQFEHGKSEWRISLDKDGKMQGMTFRQI